MTLQRKSLWVLCAAGAAWVSSGAFAATVQDVRSLPAADLVILDGGAAEGWRMGSRGVIVDVDGSVVAEVVVVDVRETVAVALLDAEQAGEVKSGQMVQLNRS